MDDPNKGREVTKSEDTLVQTQAVENRPKPLPASLTSMNRFSKKEKWLIVSFTAFAGLFKYVICPLNAWMLSIDFRR